MRNIGQIAKWIPAGALLALLFFNTVLQPLSPTLDSSFQGLLEYSAHSGMQYGRDVAGVTGPYGYVLYHIGYAGTLFWQRIALNLLLKILFAWILIETARRCGRPAIGALVLLPLVLFGSRMQDDWLVDMALLLGGWLALERIASGVRDWLLPLVCGLCGFCCLLKSSNLVKALFLMGLIGGLCALHRRWTPLWQGALCFAATLLAAWFAAGQGVRGLLPYFRNALVLSAEYNESHAIPAGTIALLACGATAAVLIAVLIVLRAASSARDADSLATAALLAVFSFLCWKHGFVRADGHVQSFFHFGLFAAAFIPVALRGRAGRLSLALSAVLFCVCLQGARLESFERLSVLKVPQEVGQRLMRNLRILTAPVQHRNALDAARERNRRECDLPEMRRAAAGGTVDYFGTVPGIALLNGFNYRPRPLSQAYLATGRTLMELNYQHGRPEFFILGAETIDNRFVSGDDSLVLRDLLQHYRPVLVERNRFLLRRAGPPDTQGLQAAGSARANRGVWVPVPRYAADEALLVSVEAETSLPGMIVSLLFRAPICVMETRSETGVQDRHRILLHSARTPLVIDPPLETPTDLIHYFYRLDHPHLEQIRVVTQSPREQHLLATEMKFCFWKIRRTVYPGTPRPLTTVSPE